MIKIRKKKSEANELQGIANHDANGNMVIMLGLKAKYDAWNRLTEVRDSSDNLIAQYEYNGLNQRIKKTVGSVVTKSFFNENWQELESQTGSQVTSYVWGLRYIDDLILREKGEERLYSLADPNWNVIALVNTSGTVVERMKYDAFGSVSWLDAAYGAKAASTYNWNRTFTGQVLDSETLLMLYRNRYFNTLIGRWTSRDPIGYDAMDLNLFRYVFNVSINRIDPTGYQVLPMPPIFGNPDDYYGQIPIPDAPPLPPIPTGKGCPKGWKIVQNTPPVANGCGPAGNGVLQDLARISTTIGQGIGGADFTPACNNHDLCWGDCSSNRKKLR